MSELPDPDDATFRLATGEELVLPGDADAEELATTDSDQASASAAPSLPGIPPGIRAPRPSYRDRRLAGRLRARKVRRLVRHVEPWSMLKVSLLFYFCLWVILLIAGVILWSFAVDSGTIDNFENFIKELFALDSFEFNADEIFRASAIGGLVLVVAGSGFTVLMAVLFNLISDVTGGVRFTVVEEETARPRPKRTRPRHGARPIPAAQPGAAHEMGAASPVLEEASYEDEVDQAGADVPILPTAESAEESGDAPVDEEASVDEPSA
ncbi:MAG: DUF3566 domain-containing protein [Acidimicrobiales bacterium]|jgi:hypothetical protein|nr:DUF3566 domain-containing protein [Acidimicrobiales bacterium]